MPRPLVVTVAACVCVVAASCADSYGRDVQIDYFVDNGATEDQATCMVDTLEAEIGTDALDDAVDQDPEDYSPELRAAFSKAQADCVFADPVPD